MSDQPVTADRAAERRRRLAAVGDVVTGPSGDEPGGGWSERDVRDRDDEILSDVPPHHG